MLWQRPWVAPVLSSSSTSILHSFIFDQAAQLPINLKGAREALDQLTSYIISNLVVQRADQSRHRSFIPDHFTESRLSSVYADWRIPGGFRR